MRKIKFRCWDKHSKVMINWEDMQNYFSDQTTFIDLEKLFLFLQYTGVKDKKGKEIYEGDILYVAGIGNVQIEFLDGAFGWFEEGTFTALFEDYENDIEEVIGNKFENPKLLEEK